MKNTAINNLSYTGLVTLSQYIGRKKVKIIQIHNTGGSSLFNFLADCLIGDFAIARATRPTKIMLLRRTVDSDGKVIEYIPASGFIYLLARPEKVYNYNDIESRVRYSFIIPKELIENINDFTALGIGLFTDDAKESNPDEYAAFCKLESLTDSNNLANAALVVDWELIISNITNSTEAT